jgi:hypothetical protein
LDAGDHHVAFVELDEILVAAEGADAADAAPAAASKVVVGVDGSEAAVLTAAAAAAASAEEANAAMSTAYLRSIGAITAAGRAVVPSPGAII